MKTLILALAMTSTLSATTAHAGMSPAYIECPRLYALGWDNMGGYDRFYYIFTCKPHGWE